MNRGEGGFLVNGMKHYAINATLAEWCWIGSVGFEDQPKLKSRQDPRIEL